MPLAWNSAEVKDDVGVDDVVDAVDAEVDDDVTDPIELAIATCLQSYIGAFPDALKARLLIGGRSGIFLSQRDAEEMQVRSDAGRARALYSG